MTIICDLDDTLADARWRMPHYGNWDKFYGLSIQDKPLPFCRMIRNFSSVVIFTAREEKYRPVTIEWLIKHDIAFLAVFMRPDGNKQTSSDLKVGLANHIYGEDLPSKISLVIDDRQDVVEAFQAAGVSTLQPRYGEEPKIKRNDPRQLELQL